MIYHVKSLPASAVGDCFAGDCFAGDLQHRDLKLDNILTDETKEGADVKLVDFGLSAHFEDFRLEHDVVGTWVRRIYLDYTYTTSFVPMIPAGLSFKEGLAGSLNVLYCTPFVFCFFAVSLLFVLRFCCGCFSPLPSTSISLSLFFAACCGPTLACLWTRISVLSDILTAPIVRSIVRCRVRHVLRASVSTDSVFVCPCVALCSNKGVHGAGSD